MNNNVTIPGLLLAIEKCNSRKEGVALIHQVTRMIEQVNPEPGNYAPRQENRERSTRPRKY